MDGMDMRVLRRRFIVTGCPERSGDWIKAIRLKALRDLYGDRPPWQLVAVARQLTCPMQASRWRDFSQRTTNRISDQTYTAERKHEGLRVFMTWDRRSQFQFWSRTVDSQTLLPVPINLNVGGMTSGKGFGKRVMFDAIITIKHPRIKEAVLRKCDLRLTGGCPQRVLWEYFSANTSLGRPHVSPLWFQAIVTDLLWKDGPVWESKWETRRKMLAVMGPRMSHMTAIKMAKLIPVAQAFGRAQRFGWGGIIYKKKVAKYIPRPSRTTRMIKRKTDEPEPWYGVTDWYSPEHPSPSV